ncbi:MAG: hypothetical protein JNK60_19980 [Acidobacteria bacterium]|nr:hypothetical protein [Acidobacteriota bacterium]
MKLRRFKPAGLARFEDELSAITAGTQPGLSQDLVTSPELSEDVPGGVEVTLEGIGTTRLQAAGYLHGLFESAGLLDEDEDEDGPLWAWLSAFAFDAVCHRNAKGKRVPGAKTCYIPALHDARRTYRHRLLGPYLIFHAHRDDSYRAICLLTQPLSRPGWLVERFAARTRLVACPAAVGVASVLFTTSDGKIRRDASAAVDRLSDFLMQLDRTHDIYGMSVDGLTAMLPADLKAFARPRSGRSGSA